MSSVSRRVHPRSNCCEYSLGISHNRFGIKKMTHEFETAVWNHLLEHPFCIQCGKQAKTVYYTKETDNIPEILELNGIRYVPVCARCKNAIKKNLRVCPQCKTNYIPITGYKCTDCLTTEECITLRVDRNDQKRKDRLQRAMSGSG